MGRGSSSTANISLEGSKATVDSMNDFAKKQRLKNDVIVRKKRIKSVYNIATSRYASERDYQVTNNDSK